jgi:hypothetical protein
VTTRVENFKGHTQGFVANVDSETTKAIPSIEGRVEGDAFILLISISVVGWRRADRSANNE